MNNTTLIDAADKIMNLVSDLKISPLDSLALLDCIKMTIWLEYDFPISKVTFVNKEIVAYYAKTIFKKTHCVPEQT